MMLPKKEAFHKITRWRLGNGQAKIGQERRSLDLDDNGAGVEILFVLFKISNMPSFGSASTISILAWEWPFSRLIWRKAVVSCNKCAPISIQFRSNRNRESTDIFPWHDTNQAWQFASLMRDILIASIWSVAVIDTMWERSVTVRQISLAPPVSTHLT